ncbi:hypothetical protein Tco_1553448 [Tanacetum coccineum]
MTAAIATTTIVGASSALMPGTGIEPVPHSIFRDSASPSTPEVDVASPSQPAGAEVSCDTFYVSQDMDSETLQQIYFERRCARLTGLLREKDVDIANLKAQLSLKEAEADEAIRLYN